MVYSKIFLILLLLSVHVHSHGYMIYPEARQYYCSMQGDYWNGPQSIKDEGCRQAYQQSGTYQFVQKHEVSANAGQNYRDINHVQNNVIPRNLCGGNDPQKSGLSVPANWHYTVISGTTLNMEFCATAAHIPSYWEIFISKDSYDPTREALEWRHLDFHDEFCNIQPQQKGPFSSCQSGTTFNMTISNLPPRQKQFVIFVRWQRIDPAGEGFYNCIDVQYG